MDNNLKKILVYAYYGSIVNSRAKNYFVEISQVLNLKETSPNYSNALLEGDISWYDEDGRRFVEYRIHYFTGI